MKHNLVAAVGVAALLAVTGCSSAVAGAPVPSGQSGSEETTSTEKTQETGFDECGLIEPDELASALGVDAMFITGRSVMTLSNEGTRRATCDYYPEDDPVSLGMSLSTVSDTDPERFFAPFARDFDNVQPIHILGDRAEAVAYKANGTTRHFIEVRTISGNRGLHLFYSYKDDGGLMPKADGIATAVFLATALERLPDEVEIPDGTPEGRCADFDLSSAAEVVGAELTMARSVLSDRGDLSCYFRGGEASLEVAVDADSQWSVEPEEVTHADIGDGARVIFTEAKTVTGSVNLGGQFVSITMSYDGDASSITGLRPADIELVREVVDTISEGN